MGRYAEVNSNVVLAVTLWNGATNRGVRARVFNSAGTEVSGSPFTLTHRNAGHYTGTGWNPTSEGQFSVSYEIYTTTGFTVADLGYEWGSEEVEIRSLDQDLATLISRITAGRATNLDNLDALVSSRQADADALTRYNNVFNRIGAPVGASISADIAAVKTDTNTLTTRLTAGRATALDNLDATISSRSTQTSVTAIDTKLGTPAGASVSVDIASIKSDSGTLITRLTAGRATNLDNLDATISSRSSQTTQDAINTKLGTPAGASVSADIASIKSDSGTLITRLTAGRATNLDNLDATISSRSSQVTQDAINTKLGTPAGASVSADIAAIKSDSGTLITRLTATRAGNLDNLDATVSSRATQASVDNIQNNTSFVGVVPPVLILPTAGSKAYRFFANLFDNSGNPEDPDSNAMNIRIEDNAGVVVVATTAMTRTAQGRFQYDYNVNSTDTERPLRVFFEYVENTVSFQQVRTTEVQEFESKLDTLLTRLTPGRASNLDNLDVLVSSRESTTNAATRETNIMNRLGAPVGASLSADVAAVKTDTTTLTSRLTAGRATNLDNLDATISSRESAANASTRETNILNRLGTPTGASVSADIASVKTDTGILTSRLTATRAGNLDNLDTTISSRATQTSVTAIDTKLGTPAGASVSADVAAVKSDSAAIKVKTDQLTFSGGRVDANISGAAEDSIVDKVWNEPLADHNTAGSMGANQNLIDDDKANTDTLLARLTAQRALNLDNLDALISSRQAESDALTRYNNVYNRIGAPVNSTIAADIAAVKSDSASIKAKTDQIVVTSGRVDSNISSAQENSIASKVWDQPLASHTSVGSVGFNQNLIDDIEADTASLNDVKLTTARANRLDNLDALVSSRASQASVDAIQNNTRFVGIVPPTMILPTGGSKDYKFYARLFDETGNPEDPDSNTMNIRIETNTGTVVVPTSTMTRTAAGQYEYVYAVTSADVERPLVVFFEYVENAVAFQQVRTTEVQEFESKLDTLLARLTPSRATNLDNLDTTVSSRESAAAAAVRETNILNRLGTPAGASVSVDIAAIKADTGTLVGRLTALRAANLDNLDAAITTRESESSAASRAAADIGEHNTTQAAIGALNDLSEADVTSALDNQGLTTARTANLDNLDTPVSTRESETNAAARAANAHSDALAIQSDIAALPTADEITDAVLDEPIAGHVNPGSVGEAIASSGATTPTAVASAVWNALTGDYNAPNTFGSFISVIRQYAEGNNNILTDGTYGPAALRALILNVQVSIEGEINQNETKIDLIIPAVNAARNAVIAEVDNNEVAIGALSTQLSNAQMAIIGEIDQNETKIDALGLQVATIQNNTTSRFIVPNELFKPGTGSKDYQFHIRLYDETGNPEAPDTAPTIHIRRLDTGVDIVVNAAMTQLGANVGAYFYTFTITSGTDLYQMLVEATVTENGVSRLVPAVSEIVEFQSDLDSIQAAVAAVDAKTANVQTQVNHPTYGLSALKTGQNNIVSEIDQNEAKIDGIKAKTDTLPNNIATQPDVAAVNATVLTRPTIGDIITQLNLVRDSIKGSSNRSNTEVYDKIDFTPLAKTSDPRFNNLDTTISSRSTLTAAQVWAHATRTLTSVVLPGTEVAKIWDYLASGATTPSSMGKLIVDMLDAKVSTRATQGQVASALAGVAQETTVSAGFGATASSLAGLTSTTNLIQNLVNLIKAKTDTLPATPASEATLQAETTAIDNAIANLQAALNLVKTATDRIPAQPATEGAVTARPTNPLLTTDARLNRLDVNVSSRSTLTTADLANLTSDADLTAAINQVLTAISNVLTQVNAANNAIALRPTDTAMNTKFGPVAKEATLNAAATAILNAINDIPSGGGGGGATPAQIWNYATRTLTASPTDISQLATAAQVTALGGPEYSNEMSTVFVNSTNEQEIIAWGTKNGQRVVGSDCTVTVKNALGVTKWTAHLDTPNADGVFRFRNAIVVGPDENYYVVVEIVVDGALRRSHKPFFTVG